MSDANAEACFIVAAFVYGDAVVVLVEVAIPTLVCM